MSALLPLLHDILPMIMPSSISITKGSDLLPPPPPAASGAASSGPDHANHHVRVISRDAIVNKSDRMCASVLVLKPTSSSAVHHNGEQDAIIYVAAGCGALFTSPKSDDVEFTPQRHSLVAGDFAFIPPWTEHQAHNDSADQDLVWVVMRSGHQPVEVSLAGWGGPQLKSAKSS